MNNEVTTEEIIENTTENIEVQELTEKVDEVIYYQKNSFSLGIISISILFAILTIYLIYKFIINFVEF